jgi:hypothetical protein
VAFQPNYAPRPFLPQFSRKQQRQPAMVREREAKREGESAFSTNEKAAASKKFRASLKNSSVIGF